MEDGVSICRWVQLVLAATNALLIWIAVIGVLVRRFRDKRGALDAQKGDLFVLRGGPVYLNRPAVVRFLGLIRYGVGFLGASYMVRLDSLKTTLTLDAEEFRALYRRPTSAEALAVLTGDDSWTVRTLGLSGRLVPTNPAAPWSFR